RIGPAGRIEANPSIPGARLRLHEYHLGTIRGVAIDSSWAHALTDDDVAGGTREWTGDQAFHQPSPLSGGRRNLIGGGVEGGPRCEMVIERQGAKPPPRAPHHHPPPR